MENDIVILDVGGYKYKTTISTLTKFPHTYFNGLFSGKYPIHKQQDGSIFIDRDGKHFRYLLNFLRNGRIVFPENESDRRELMLEAEFYLLKDLILAAEEQQEEQQLLESKKEHCHWESNLIFIGYKNIDFENIDHELRGLKEALQDVQKPDTTEHVWKSIHDPGLTVIFQICHPSLQQNTDFSLKNIGQLLQHLRSWNRPYLRFVLVYDAELVRELLKISGEKFNNSSYVWYFSRGKLIECRLQWKLKYVAENIWKHYYLNIDLSSLQPHHRYKNFIS